MERNVIFVLVGVAMGVTIAVHWLPPPEAEPRVIERPPPLIDPIAPGRRAIVLRADGLPAAFVDVYLTDLATGQVRGAIRTNVAGHLVVPSGRFRVQAFSRRVEGVDRVLEVPDGDHPDIEVRLEKVELFRLLGAR